MRSFESGGANGKAHETYSLIPVKPGVIGISNDFGFRDELSPEVKYTLCEEEIHFPPYQAPQLEAILQRRVEGALYDGATASGVISLFAALSAQDTGSARQALNLLYKAGELARAAGESTITEFHVHEARDALEQSQIEHGMCEITRHGHLALVATLDLALQDETPARVRDIFPRYRTIAEHSGADPLVRRRMHDHLADFAMVGILDRWARNEGRAGGQYYEYELKGDLTTVCVVVGDIEGISLSETVARHT